MGQRIGRVLLAGFLAAAVGGVQAGRPRTGQVVTPFGPLYDTGSPEWRASGGDVFVYQQLLEQKMMRQQQQMMLKMQQAQAKGANPKTRNGGFNSGTQQTPPNFTVAPPTPRKKKRRTYVPTGNGAAKAEAKPAPGAAPDPLEGTTTTKPGSSKPRF